MWTLMDFLGQLWTPWDTCGLKRHLQTFLNPLRTLWLRWDLVRPLKTIGLLHALLGASGTLLRILSLPFENLEKSLKTFGSEIESKSFQSFQMPMDGYSENETKPSSNLWHCKWILHKNGGKDQWSEFKSQIKPQLAKKPFGNTRFKAIHVNLMAPQKMPKSSDKGNPNALP